jgi:hypothetical protein
MIAAAVALWAVTESRDPGTRQLDLVGAGLATGGLFALVWALIETGTHARGSAYTLGFGRGRPARRLSLFGVINSITLYFQNLKGYSPLQAGIRSLPMTVMITLLAPLAGEVEHEDGCPRAAVGRDAVGLGWDVRALAHPGRLLVQRDLALLHFGRRGDGADHAGGVRDRYGGGGPRSVAATLTRSAWQEGLAQLPAATRAAAEPLKPMRAVDFAAPRAPSAHPLRSGSAGPGSRAGWRPGTG